MKITELTYIDKLKYIIAAIKKESRCRMTLLLDGKWQLHDSYIFGSYIQDEYFRILTPLVNDTDLLVIPDTHPVEISIRFNHKKIAFVTKMITAGKENLDDYIVFKWPEKVYHLHRAFYDRIPYYQSIRIKYRDNPKVIYAESRDISVGGIKIASESFSPDSIGKSVVCSFKIKQETISVEGIIRNIQEIHNETQIQIHFVGLIHTSNNRVILAKIADLSRLKKRQQVSRKPLTTI